MESFLTGGRNHIVKREGKGEKKMKKNTMHGILIGAAALTAVAAYSGMVPPITAQAATVTLTQQAPGQVLPSDLSQVEFEFASGAGGWCTTMQIAPDGSFSGNYHDSEMGSTGVRYPNGTIYICSFSGKFTDPVKVDDYTYKLQIRELHYDKPSGTQEIADGILYQYTTPYGLDGGTDFYLYLPGKTTASLPVGFMDWMPYSTTDDQKTLPFYGFYNEKEAEGFYSYTLEDVNAVTYDNMYVSEVAYVQGQADALNTRLSQESLTQQEMNQISGQLYELWDSELNRLWKVLKEMKDADSFSALRKEQRNWISQKETAVKAAGKEWEGGSMQAMAENSKAAGMTRDRVYYLLSLIAQ